jgi:hypothetical protein
MSAHDVDDTLSPLDLVDASQELHWAVQFLASAGQTFAEPQSDDSHRATQWDATRRAFVSAPFAGAYPFRVGIRPEDLSLLLLDRTAEPLGTLPLAGVTRNEGYEWLSLGLATYMGTAPPVIERPEFEMPPHGLGQGGKFSSDLGREFHALAGLYDHAAALLETIAEGSHGAGPVRCWPHHFDIATLLEVAHDADGTATKTIGVGLAPATPPFATWYWYVTPWPYPDAHELPALESPGVWHTEGWVGAVLTGEAISKFDPATRETQVRSFLDRAIASASEVLLG